MATDFSKVSKHPEIDTIIDRLLSGENAKDICQYLKGKYDKPDESHLRLSSSLLEEFKQKYLQQSGFLDRIAQQDVATKLDDKISESLINTKSYKKRLEEYKEESIDVNRKILQFIHLIEARFEQVFDKIQENPGNTKMDYVLLKYFEQGKAFAELYDKVVNKAPDQRIEHVHSVKIVEDSSAALQEAIVKVLERMQPDLVNVFMDAVRVELLKAKNPNDVYASPTPLNDIKNKTALLANKVEAIDSKFEEVIDGD